MTQHCACGPRAKADIQTWPKYGNQPLSKLNLGNVPFGGINRQGLKDKAYSSVVTNFYLEQKRFELQNLGSISFKHILLYFSLKVLLKILSLVISLNGYSKIDDFYLFNLLRMQVHSKSAFYFHFNFFLDLKVFQKSSVKALTTIYRKIDQVLFVLVFKFLINLLFIII